MIGMKFSKLLVLERIGSVRKNCPRFKCICECGAYTETDGRHLRSSSTKSCGCFSREMTVNRTRTHGKSNTTEFRIWSLIKSRCFCNTDRMFKYYGGRGITVSPEWVRSFETFLKDMGNRPLGGSIDRINNNGNYCKENCRWATKIEQANNKRTNKLHTYKGLTLTSADWSRIAGISSQLFYTRMKRGWSFEKTINTPTANHPKKRHAPSL